MIAGYVLAAGAVLPRWLSVVSGIIAGCDRCAPAGRIQHDLHEVRCACGRPHVPVERCQQLIADVTGAAISAGFVQSCLRQVASLAAEVVRLIRTLITAAAVAGFDETTLRAGPAGGKKYAP
jgi:hypothetical protein